jgi:hypothetical protein
MFMKRDHTTFDIVMCQESAGMSCILCGHKIDMPESIECSYGDIVSVPYGRGNDVKYSGFVAGACLQDKILFAPPN